MHNFDLDPDEFLKAENIKAEQMRHDHLEESADRCWELGFHHAAIAVYELLLEPVSLSYLAGASLKRMPDPNPDGYVVPEEAIINTYPGNPVVLEQALNEVVWQAVYSQQYLESIVEHRLHSNIATAYLELKDPAAAFNQVDYLEPPVTFEDAGLLARMYAANGNTARAEKAADKMLQLYRPDGTFLYWTTEWEAISSEPSVKKLMALGAFQNNDDPNEPLSHAHDMGLAQRAVDSALNVYDEYIQGSWNDYILYNLEAGNIDQALTGASNLAHLEIERLQVYEPMAYIFNRSGDAAHAKELFERMDYWSPLDRLEYALALSGMKFDDEAVHQAALAAVANDQVSEMLLHDHDYAPIRILPEFANLENRMADLRIGFGIS